MIKNILARQLGIEETPPQHSETTASSKPLEGLNKENALPNVTEEVTHQEDIEGEGSVSPSISAVMSLGGLISPLVTFDSSVITSCGDFSS